MRRWILGLLISLWPVAFSPAAVAAQGVVPECEVRGSHQWLSTRASPFDSAMVTVGGSTAKMCYSRPSARGRVVMGGLVQNGRAWRTGANEPTVLHLPFEAEVGGLALEPGRYLVLSVPGEETWQIAFYRAGGTGVSELFRSQDLVGFGAASVEPLPGHVEMFTIAGVGGQQEAEFHLEWERTRVRLLIRRSR